MWKVSRSNETSKSQQILPKRYRGFSSRNRTRDGRRLGSFHSTTRGPVQETSWTPYSITSSQGTYLPLGTGDRPRLQVSQSKDKQIVFGGKRPGKYGSRTTRHRSVKKVNRD
ncbi:hypothetical protein B566_EDAN010621 [Ephemera danica]|nr:hypothetical protein B566_EDAN010621 [Ephemera danica]